MKQPSTVVFDLGGVLIDWNPRHLYRDLFGGDDARMERFLTEICSPAWNEQQDGGRTIAEAEAELLARHPDEAEMIRAFYAGFDRMMRDQIHGTVDVLEELHAAGVPLYGLTNWSAETIHHGLKRFAFFQRFRGVVVSGEIKLKKPDATIFAHLLARYGLQGPDCVFIDDSPRNVVGARAAGLHALHFTTPEALRRDLRALGLPLAA